MIELNGEAYLDGNEACNLLGVKVSTLYTYVSRGLLRSYRQGIKRQRLYKRAELEALLQLRPSNTFVASDLDLGQKQDHEPGEDEKGQGPQLPLAEDWVPNV